MDDDEAVSRYAYLLQPIRDLQKNFEVNLVDILDEYLEKLKVAETTTNLDVTNGRKFDFNVASVVVRGTTMVYGKKIELVLGESRNFLEQLGSSKNAKKSMGKKSTENGDSPEDEAEQAKKRDPLHLTELKEFRKRVKDTMFLVMKEHVRFHAEPTASIPLCLEPLVDVEKTPFTLMAADGKTLIGKMEDFFVNRLKAINGALYHTTENLQWTNVISDPNPTVELDDSDFDEPAASGVEDADNGQMINVKRERRTEENQNEDGDKEADSGRGSPNDDFHHDPINVDEYLPGYDLPADDNYAGGAEMTAAGGGDFEAADPPRQSQATVLHRQSEAPNRPSTRLQIKLERPDSVMSFTNSVIATNKDGEPLPVNKDKRRLAKIKKNEKAEKVWKFLEMDAELDPFEDKLGDVFEDAPFKRRPYKEIRKPVSAEYLVKKKKQQAKNKTESEQICETLKFINEQVYMHGKSIRVNADIEDDWQSNCLQTWILQADRYLKTKEREEKKKREARGQTSFMEDRAMVDDLRDAVLGMQFDFSKSNLPKEKVESIQEKFRLIGEANWEKFVNEDQQQQRVGRASNELEQIPEDEELDLNDAEGDKENEGGRKKSSIERSINRRRKSTLMPDGEVEKRLIQGADDFDDDEEFDAMVDDPVGAMNAIEDVGERFADVDDVELNEVELPNYLNYTLSALEGGFDVPDYGSDRNSSIDAERVRSVAEIMRGFTKEFYEKRDHQTGELANKVRVWEAKIGPELELEALRPEFRVHDYGKKVLDTLKEDQDKGQKMPFEELVVGKPQYEHGRVLLASLLLTNQKFVQLIKEKDLDAQRETGYEFMKIFVKDLNKIGTREIVFEE